MTIALQALRAAPITVAGPLAVMTVLLWLATRRMK